MKRCTRDYARISTHQPAICKVVIHSLPIGSNHVIGCNMMQVISHDLHFLCQILIEYKT